MEIISFWVQKFRIYQPRHNNICVYPTHTNLNYLFQLKYILVGYYFRECISSECVIITVLLFLHHHIIIVALYLHKFNLFWSFRPIDIYNIHKYLKKWRWWREVLDGKVERWKEEGERESRKGDRVGKGIEQESGRER